MGSLGALGVSAFLSAFGWDRIHLQGTVSFITLDYTFKL